MSTNPTRDALDAAIREYVRSGAEAYKRWSDAVGYEAPKAVRDKLYAEANKLHNEFECNAHDEGLNCYLDHEHARYEEMLDFIAAKLNAALKGRA